MVVFSSRIHEETTLVVPFGGDLPQDGAAWWPLGLHLDRLQGFWGLSILLLVQLGFILLCLVFHSIFMEWPNYPLGGMCGGDGEFNPETIRFVALLIQ